jgi:hypothetical protein
MAHDGTTTLVLVNPMFSRGTGIGEASTLKNRVETVLAIRRNIYFDFRERCRVCD